MYILKSVIKKKVRIKKILYILFKLIIYSDGKMTDTSNQNTSSPSSISSSSTNGRIKIKIKSSKTSTTNRRSQRRRTVIYKSKYSFHISFFNRILNHQCERVQ